MGTKSWVVGSFLPFPQNFEGFTSPCYPSLLWGTNILEAWAGRDWRQTAGCGQGLVGSSIDVSGVWRYVKLSPALWGAVPARALSGSCDFLWSL